MLRYHIAKLDSLLLWLYYYSSWMKWQIYFELLFIIQLISQGYF